VFALILAAGYLLKLSFDRGWISPAMRCGGGVVAGLGVGALGWRLHPRYRTYGAALIGCGAAIVYLSVWAACQLYGFFPPTTGIAGLALIALSLAAIAYAIDVEALGLTAVLGAFIAPVLLGRSRANADLLLLYQGCMAAALGWVSQQRRWRYTTFAIAFSFFGLGWAAASETRRPMGALAYAVLGGAGGVWVGLRERWWETRFFAFWGGWALLATVEPKLDPRWPVSWPDCCWPRRCGATGCATKDAGHPEKPSTSSPHLSCSAGLCGRWHLHSSTSTTDWRHW
jgi:hypothetical protein